MAKKRSKKLTLDLDNKTAMLIGSLAQKGLIKLKHDAKLGYGEAKLDMTDNPGDQNVVLRANLNLAHAYGFPFSGE